MPSKSKSSYMKKSKNNKNSMNKTSLKKSKKSSKKSVTSKKECNMLDSWHMPWNYKKHKADCNDKGCIWYGSLFGSYCVDKKTVTEEKLSYRGLEDKIYLASLEKDELVDILKECNMANEKHLERLIKHYASKRIDNITSIVIHPLSNLLLKTKDEILFKIISNAKKEKLSGVKSYEDIKYRQLVMRRDCFNKKLGTNPARYVERTLQSVKDNLNSCGIGEGERLYNIAMYNYHAFSKYNRIKPKSPKKSSKKRNSISRKQSEFRKEVEKAHKDAFKMPNIHSLHRNAMKKHRDDLKKQRRHF